MSGSAAADDHPQDRPASRRIRIIWNDAAGDKAGVARSSLTREALLGLLGRHGLGEDIRTSTSEDDGRREARQAVQDGCDVVVAAGGDGTIGVVARELLGEPVALGILPLGTIMNIPRMLGIPPDLEAAAGIVARGGVRAIDVGETGRLVFYEAGSVGLNAAMFREAQRFGQGDWASILRTIWVAIRYRPARIRIRLDDRVVRTRALMVAVANGPFSGAGMTVAPDARLDDGLFDVRVFRRFSKWQLVRHLAAIAFGRYRPTPQVSTYRSARGLDRQPPPAALSRRLERPGNDSGRVQGSPRGPPGHRRRGSRDGRGGVAQIRRARARERSIRWYASATIGRHLPHDRTEPLMAVDSATRMSSAEIVALNRAHTLFSWSIQGALDPDRHRPR